MARAVLRGLVRHEQDQNSRTFDHHVTSRAYPVRPLLLIGRESWIVSEPVEIRAFVPVVIVRTVAQVGTQTP